VNDRVDAAFFEPPRNTRFAERDGVDLALTFRNRHDWAAGGHAVVRAVFKSAYDCLKPAGIFLAVDHRLPADRGQVRGSRDGDVPVAYLRRIGESVGFRLAAARRSTRTPPDTAEHEGGVRVLPPPFVNNEKNHSSYAAMGESDRFTVKFIEHR